jgi:hypothetical protein
MILLAFFALVNTEPCGGAAAGTPCLCVPAGTEGSVGGSIEGCGTSATFVGVTNGAGACVVNNVPICDLDGTINAANRCCQSCGTGVTETALLTSEQCDPPTVSSGGCCATNCQFASGGTGCNDGQFCTLTDTCQAPGNTPNGVCSGTGNPTCVGQNNNVCNVGGDTCDEASDSCIPQTAQNGMQCDSGADACPDTCAGGTCPNNGNCGGGNADPHIYGPFGEKFEFHGKAGGVYNMISSRQIVVNAQMMKEGPENHFMTRVAVAFSNVTLMFDTVIRPDNYLDKLNVVLAPLGASATGSKFRTVLHLCDGQTVSITQKRTGKFFFLNIEFDTAGCHDDFNGVIGQLYQCTYDFRWF